MVAKENRVMFQDYPFGEHHYSEVYWDGHRYGVRVNYQIDDSVPIPCIYESYLILSHYTIALKKMESGASLIIRMKSSETLFMTALRDHQNKQIFVWR